MSHPQILKLDSSGQPVGWINWQKAVTHQVTGEVAWSLGEIEFSFYGGNNSITGIQSVVRTASIIAIREKTKRTKSRGKTVSAVPTLTNQHLFKRDRYLCAYCGRKFPADMLSRDHIVPTSKGGSDDWMNVVTACRKDNQQERLTILLIRWGGSYCMPLMSQAKPKS